MWKRGDGDDEEKLDVRRSRMGSRSKGVGNVGGVGIEYFMEART